MAVVEWDADHIRAELRHRFDIFFGEKMIEQMVKEKLSFLFADNTAHRRAQVMLRADEAIDEVFHVEPAANIPAAQAYGFVGLGDDLSI